MERTWQVVAVYQPAPRKVVVYGSATEVIPQGAGREFKFTAVGLDELEAIAAVRESGFFAGEVAKQFGFIAKEIA